MLRWNQKVFDFILIFYHAFIISPMACDILPVGLAMHQKSSLSDHSLCLSGQKCLTKPTISCVTSLVVLNYWTTDCGVHCEMFKEIDNKTPKPCRTAVQLIVHNSYCWWLMVHSHQKRFAWQVRFVYFQSLCGGASRCTRTSSVKRFWRVWQIGQQQKTTARAILTRLTHPWPPHRLWM